MSDPANRKRTSQSHTTRVPKTSSLSTGEPYTDMDFESLSRLGKFLRPLVSYNTWQKLSDVSCYNISTLGLCLSIAFEFRTSDTPLILTRVESTHNWPLFT